MRGGGGDFIRPSALPLTLPWCFRLYAAVRPAAPPPTMRYLHLTSLAPLLAPAVVFGHAAGGDVAMARTEPPMRSVSDSTAVRSAASRAGR